MLPQIFRMEKRCCWLNPPLGPLQLKQLPTVAKSDPAGVPAHGGRQSEQGFTALFRVHMVKTEDIFVVCIFWTRSFAPAAVFQPVFETSSMSVSKTKFGKVYSHSP